MQVGRVDFLRTLVEVNARLNSELEFDQILAAILDAAVGLTSAERGLVILVGDGTPVVEAAHGLDRQSILRSENEFDRALFEQVVARGEAILTSNAAAASPEGARRLAARSLLIVPLQIEKEVVGAVYLDRRSGDGSFSPDHLHYVECLADQAALAIERARLCEENRAQRRRIEELSRRLAEEAAARNEAPRRPARASEHSSRSRLHGEAASRSVNIIGRSSAVIRLLEVVARVADLEVPVIIEGESGTGKELVARAIHFNGRRAAGPFVAENCGALPENLFESELFGHVKGAFSGAIASRDGIFKIAAGGTLLLDEIGEMPLNLQTKLLRVLEEGTIRPVGGTEPIAVDVRVLATTNRDLARMVGEGAFREDLYFRLDVATIRVPPLRERPEDIPLLAEHFLGELTSEYGETKRHDEKALESLMKHDWPGNVRELHNVIERAWVTTPGDEIRHYPLGRKGRAREDLRFPIVEFRSSGAGGADRDIRASKTGSRESPWSGKSLKELVASFEKSLLEDALARCEGKVSRAAEALKVPRRTLRDKLVKHSLAGREEDD